MASRKRNKYPNQKKILADARRYVIRNGDYNGATPSSDFMVSGHSTGSPYSEMEELSEQVTRDAGGYSYREPEFADDRGETGYELYQGEGLGDLGGPELYGDRYAPRVPRTSRGLMIGAAVGLAATALLGGLAYLVYQSEERHSTSRRPRGRSATAHRANGHRTASTSAKPRQARSSSAKSRTVGASTARNHVSARTSSAKGKRGNSQARA